MKQLLLITAMSCLIASQSFAGCGCGKRPTKRDAGLEKVSKVNESEFTAVLVANNGSMMDEQPSMDEGDKDAMPENGTMNGHMNGNKNGQMQPKMLLIGGSAPSQTDEDGKMDEQKDKTMEQKLVV